MSNLQSKPCVICQRAKDKQYVVYEDAHWIVRHSDETTILGYFLIEPKRHIVDLSEADEQETSTYGALLSALMSAIRMVTQCARVYTFSLGESCPHYHLHVIPRTENMPKHYRGRGIMQFPLTPSADLALTTEVCARVRRELKKSSALQATTTAALR